MSIQKKADRGKFSQLRQALLHLANETKGLIEPFLLKIGFVARMQNGRKATELAYQHFGLPYSESGRQLSLPTHKKR